jgi:hypothetical protein
MSEQGVNHPILPDGDIRKEIGRSSMLIVPHQV